MSRGMKGNAPKLPNCAVLPSLPKFPEMHCRLNILKVRRITEWNTVNRKVLIYTEDTEKSYVLV